MQTVSLTLLLVVVVTCRAQSPGSRDGGHPQQPPPAVYDPPQPQVFDPTSQFEFQPPPPQPQFYQVTYADPGWDVGPGPQGDSSLGGWLEKGVNALNDVVPVAVSVVVIIVILTFLGLVNVPFLASLSETKDQLGRALASMNMDQLGRALASVDKDQLANTVALAINKYHQLFDQ